MSVEQKSTADLLRDLSSELTTLIHQEVALAKTELTEKTKKVGVGAGMFGAAAVAGLLAAGALVTAAIAGLSTALSVWLSALIVGGVLLAVAGILALTGGNELGQGSPPIPEEAIESTKEDVEWLKTQAKSARR